MHTLHFWLPGARSQATRCTDCLDDLDNIAGRCSFCSGYLCTDCVAEGPGMFECRGCAEDNHTRMVEAIEDEEVRR